jgi:hypothetical protein
MFKFDFNLKSKAMAEKKKNTTKAVNPEPQAREVPLVEKPSKPPKNEKPKGTIPLVVKKEKPAPKEIKEPVGMFEIEKTMKELGPMLKDPKTKEAAEKQLKALHERMRKYKKDPKW